MTLLSFIETIGALSFSTKALIILIVAGFMPLTAISFFRVMMPKKEKEYSKALKEMGINSSRKVRDTLSPSKYFLPVTFAFLICFLAITYFSFASEFVKGVPDSLLLTGPFFGGENAKLINQSLSVLYMAFLGGFLWSAQNIIRRLIANDLPPNVYYSAGIRIILASVIALVLSYILGEESSNNLINFKSSLAAIAFLTGMFPERVLQYLIKLFKKYVDGDNINTKELSLYRIEGISMQHKERLEEIGIDNAQNLATASLTQLLIDTPFGARQLLDWIGQAKLLCYTKSNIEALRSVGIRTIFDLYKGKKSREALREISDAVNIHTPLLEVVYTQVMDDEGIKALYEFHQRLNAPNPGTYDNNS